MPYTKMRIEIPRNCSTVGTRIHSNTQSHLICTICTFTAVCRAVTYTDMHLECFQTVCTQINGGGKTRLFATLLNRDYVCYFVPATICSIQIVNIVSSSDASTISHILSKSLLTLLTAYTTVVLEIPEQ